MANSFKIIKNRVHPENKKPSIIRISRYNMTWKRTAEQMQQL